MSKKDFVQREAELVSRSILNKQLDATKASYYYYNLEGLPSINSIILRDNKTSADLGLQGKLTPGEFISIDENGVISCTASFEYVNYNNLTNKPKVNNVELVGSLTSASLGMYTKEETNQAISNAISGVASVDIKFLSTLPTTGVKGTIYFIPSSDPTTPSAFDQYVYTNNTWTKTGSFTINITGKLDKVSTASTNPQVYGKKADGSQCMIDLDNDTATEGNIPIYGEDGELIIGDSVNENSATTKNYVDSSLSSKQDVLTNGYEDLAKKPSINGVYLIGNKTSADLGISGGSGQTYTGDETTIHINSNNVISSLQTVPTKTSQLTNDSGFLTSHQDLSNMASKLYVNSQIDSLSIPTKTSELTNDSDFTTKTYTDTQVATKQNVLTNGYNDLSNKPKINNVELSGNKTLGDLGVYSKTEVDNAISGITQIDYVIYGSLPATGEKGKIYFIYNSDVDAYDEYVWINNKFEALGPAVPGSSTKVDKITTGDTLRAYVVKADNSQGSIPISGSGTSLLTEHQDISGKQNTLTAGSNITISNEGVISATGALAVDYTTIPNKPKINNVELTSNRVTSELNISYNDLTNLPSIPVNTSQLTNDSGFITLNDITNKQDKIVAGSNIYIADDGKTISATGALAVDYTTIPNKPKINSIEVSGNKSLGDLGIYSKTEVDTAINNAVSGITQIDYQVVQTLPTTGVKGVIYLIYNESEMAHDEYVWVNNKFELLGPAHIDMPEKVDKITTGDTLRAYVVKADNTQGSISISGSGDSLLTEHQDISGKQNVLTPGTGIDITDNVISSTITGVPSCTTADNGKVLKVVNGVPTWVEDTSGGSTTGWIKCTLTGNVEGHNWGITNNTATSINDINFIQGTLIYPFLREVDTITTETLNVPVEERYYTSSSTEITGGAFGFSESDTSMIEVLADITAPSTWTYQEGDELTLKVISTLTSKTSTMVGKVSVEIYKKYDRG